MNSSKIDALRVQQEVIVSNATNNPGKFAGYYWNIEHNKPSDTLAELFSLLLPSLTATATLEEAVEATQKAWIQTTRWEVKQDTPYIQELKEQIQPLLERLGLTASISSEGKFDTALLLAGRANIFLARSYALADAIKENKIELSHVDILAGKQKLHPLELEILEKSSLNICNAATEEEMVQAVAEKMFQPLGVECTLVTTDLGERKPNTEQNVNRWLDMADRKGISAVVISDPQFAVYQYLQCMDALYNRGVSDVNFALLSKQLDERAFTALNVSMQETQENPILLHLDTIARTLYTLRGQINRGFLSTESL